jgi:hypothetical protein
MLRDLRRDTEAQLGRKLTQPEVAKMWKATEANFRMLGFKQQANGQWYRPRSAVERLLG